MVALSTIVSPVGATLYQSELTYTYVDPSYIGNIDNGYYYKIFIDSADISTSVQNHPVYPQIDMWGPVQYELYASDDHFILSGSAMYHRGEPATMQTQISGPGIGIYAEEVDWYDNWIIGDIFIEQNDITDEYSYMNILTLTSFHKEEPFPTPEPSTIILVIVGLIGISGLGKRKLLKNNADYFVVHHM
jgi:hypothetical protein